MMSAGSNGQVSLSAVGSAVGSATLADSVSSTSSRVVTLDNIVRIAPTTAAVGPATSGACYCVFHFLFVMSTVLKAWLIGCLWPPYVIGWPLYF